MKKFIRFIFEVFHYSLTGSWKYHVWLAGILIVALIGLQAYCKQVVYGLSVTGLNNHVPWGAYIANFTFMAGMPAVAIILVVPAYFYHKKELHGAIIFGELLTLSSLAICLLFILVDLGRPDRMWHMMDPFQFNFPSSMLSWDVVMLNGYLALTAYIAGYHLFMLYQGRKISKKLYTPFLFISVFWAIGHITVVAFLYCGLGGRPFWNSSVLAPKLLGLVFVGGAAFVILVLQQLRHWLPYEIKEEAFNTLRIMVQMAIMVDLFLVGCELFTELYTQSSQSHATQYVFFGLKGHSALTPFMWGAIGMNIVALGLFFVPLSKGFAYLNIACVLSIVGIWIERGIGVVLPGFIPSPLGEIREYIPTLNETLICFGTWSLGLFVGTLMIKGASGVLCGHIRSREVSLETIHELVAEEFHLEKIDNPNFANPKPMSWPITAAVCGSFLLLGWLMVQDVWGKIPPQDNVVLYKLEWGMIHDRPSHEFLVMLDETAKGQRCDECHEKGAKPGSENPRGHVDTHTIKTAHGMNDRCFNCHNPLDRDNFVTNDGQTIEYKDVMQLCGKCHGPTYREWEQGSHGRRTGYWDASKGEQKRSRCIVCHDPHNPKFTPMMPEPAPYKLH